jgi:hypothetical protein
VDPDTARATKDVVMAEIRVKVVHDCETPDMVVGQEAVFDKTWWGKKIQTDTISVYFTGEARWDCPVCHAEWSYFGIKFSGHWVCIARSEKWETREV